MHDSAPAIWAKKPGCPVLPDACSCLLQQLSAVCRSFAQAAQRLLARVRQITLDCLVPTISMRLMLEAAPAVEEVLVTGPCIRISGLQAFVAAAVDLTDAEVGWLFQPDDADLADNILCESKSVTSLTCGNLYVPNSLPHLLLHLNIEFAELWCDRVSSEMPGLVDRLLTALPTPPALQSLVLDLGMNYMSPALSQACPGCMS